MSVADNPYQSSPAAETSSAVERPAARRSLLPVAVGILVTSILHSLGWLFYCVYVYSVVARPDVDRETVHALTVYCLYYGITVLYCLLLISGAFSMLRQGSYLWAVTTCILAIIPLFGPCYFLAVPFGIWGLVILRRPAVRDSFARM